MHYSPAQITAIKNAIAADPAFAGLPNNTDGAFVIANALNLTANPDFIVWKKTPVSITDIGDNIVGTELAGLTSTNLSRLQTVVALSGNGVNPSLADRRAFFDDIFSGAGGTATRAKLAILWRRKALRIEKILATGTGSDASPATLSHEGEIDYAHVDEIRHLP